MKNLLSLSILTWILINGLVNNIGASQKQSPCQKGSDYLPDQVVVKFQPAVGDVESSSLFSSIYQKYQVKRAERLFPNVKYQPTPKRKIVDLSRIYLLQVPEDSDIEIICKELGGMPGVAYAEPYYIFYVDEIPNDPRYMYQHHLPQIKAPEAWDMAKGDSTVVIAMVDNGTDWKHPDLLDNIYTNEAEAKGLPGVDDDKNGKVD
ncbi:MAG: hypothetical protein ONB05_06920, partial [candidate division KSB1 bacterium]|nr:hypothetical protein [candidate division KSB1 bacterium]